MATTLTTLNKSWDRTRSVRTGHFACYFPGNASPADTLVLFGPDGREVARNTEGLRDFDLAIDEATGDLFALYCAFVDGDARPIRRWNTGVKVPPLTAAPAPPPSPSTNGPKIEAIRELLRQAQALLDTLT
jgi:hypothetical protein